MRKFTPFVFAGLMILSGCGKNSGSIEEREERDPNVLSGQEYMDQGNYDAAVAEFKLALEQEPLMARPHLNLATIYQNYTLNPIHAIYHYDRYLELRPDSEKAEFIIEQKQKVAQTLADALGQHSQSYKDVVAKYNTLLQQNTDLKRQLASALKNQQPAAQTATSTAPAKKTVTQTVPKSTTAAAAKPKPAASAPKHQIYHVVSGDTLTKISTKFYGESGKWDIIYEANKEMMRSPGDLKVGQTLVIPAVGN